jgi:hypothetical protein
LKVRRKRKPRKQVSRTFGRGGSEKEEEDKGRNLPQKGPLARIALQSQTMS